MFRAPTDNDKGFGKWLARDWREAGLTNLTRTVGSFSVGRVGSKTVRIVAVTTYCDARGRGEIDDDLDAARQRHAWTWRRNLRPLGACRCCRAWGWCVRSRRALNHVRWLGRGPWENYSDRKQSADLGVWSGTVDEQYVPYVRPQENGNKEDTRWLALTDDAGQGLKISTLGDAFSFSALHFTAADLASARHNYELKPRPGNHFVPGRAKCAVWATAVAGRGCWRITRCRQRVLIGCGCGSSLAVPLDFLRHFDRKMCLCSNARSVRIRPILQKVGESLANLCSF